MIFPPVDLPYLRERSRELANQVRELWESGHSADDADTPVMLRDAMAQLIDMLSQAEDLEQKDSLNEAEITTLGEYGLHLLSELSTMASSMEQTRLAEEIEHLALPFALWVARHGGELRQLRPVVNALAHYANLANQPQQMTTLYTHCCELLDAASPSCEEMALQDTSHPWRLLLLNRAIVATRSHNPELIEPAYDAIVDSLPHDAHRFFAEGMEQIAVINYPEHVKSIVRQYYLAHAAPRRLH